MRQRDKPWLALGISRATWYRHGKPTERPRRMETQAEAARDVRMSLRTYQRFERVFGSKSKLLQDCVKRGMKLGMADYLLAHPKVLRRFTEKLEGK